MAERHRDRSCGQGVASSVGRRPRLAAPPCNACPARSSLPPVFVCAMFFYCSLRMPACPLSRLNPCGTVCLLCVYTWVAAAPRVAGRRPCCSLPCSLPSHPTASLHLSSSRTNHPQLLSASLCVSPQQLLLSRPNRASQEKASVWVRLTVYMYPASPVASTLHHLTALGSSNLDVVPIQSSASKFRARVVCWLFGT